MSPIRDWIDWDGRRKALLEVANANYLNLKGQLDRANAALRSVRSKLAASTRARERHMATISATLDVQARYREAYEAALRQVTAAQATVAKMGALHAQNDRGAMAGKQHLKDKIARLERELASIPPRIGPLGAVPVDSVAEVAWAVYHDLYPADDSPGARTLVDALVVRLQALGKPPE